MLYVKFKKCMCLPVVFRGQGPPIANQEGDIHVRSLYPGDFVIKIMLLRDKIFLFDGKLKDPLDDSYFHVRI